MLPFFFFLGDSERVAEVFFLRLPLSVYRGRLSVERACRVGATLARLACVALVRHNSEPRNRQVLLLIIDQLPSDANKFPRFHGY